MLFADKSLTLHSSQDGTPFLLDNDSHPPVSYLPKLAIKTNLACREIKPSLPKEWHHVSHLLLAVPPFHFAMTMRVSLTPLAPSFLIDCAAVIKGSFHNMDIVTTEHVHDPPL